MSFSFGKTLKAYRKISCCSQREFAQKLEISQSLLSDIEHDRRELSVEKLLNLNRYFSDKSISDLLDLLVKKKLQTNKRFKEGYDSFRIQAENRGIK